MRRRGASEEERGARRDARYGDTRPRTSGIRKRSPSATAHGRAGARAARRRPVKWPGPRADVAGQRRNGCAIRQATRAIPRRRRPPRRRASHPPAGGRGDGAGGEAGGRHWAARSAKHAHGAGSPVRAVAARRSTMLDSAPLLGCVASLGLLARCAGWLAEASALKTTGGAAGQVSRFARQSASSRAPELPRIYFLETVGKGQLIGTLTPSGGPSLMVWDFATGMASASHPRSSPCSEWGTIHPVATVNAAPL